MNRVYSLPFLLLGRFSRHGGLKAPGQGLPLRGGQEERMFCASVLLLYAANRPNRLSGPAFMMKVTLRHHGLAGLMQRESGKAAPNGATRVPVADVVPRTRVGPTVLPTQFSRYGRWHGRIRSLQRASRLVKPHFNRVALNTQGLNWSLMLHASKLRCLIQQARSQFGLVIGDAVV